MKLPCGQTKADGGFVKYLKQDLHIDAGNYTEPFK